jgi:hypothetical protein
MSEKLVFNSYYSVLAVGMALQRSGSEMGGSHPVRTGVGVPQRRL